MMSPQSLTADRALPGVCRSSSHELGWSSLLARTYAEPRAAEEFTTAPTPDLLVVMQLRGSYRIESRRPDGWHGAHYRPGSMGLAVPGASSTLRWRDAAGGPPTTLQVHLRAEVVRDTGDALRIARSLAHLPDHLDLDDPVARAIVQAIGYALEHRAGPLAAEHLAHALAAQLLQHRGRPGRPPVRALAQPDLARILDFMNDRLAEPIQLDQLAGLVHLSKYHFLRMFTETVGATPRRHLARLRMARGAELLRTTDRSLTEVAAACGYASTGHFAEAFRGQYGVRPGEYRSRLRG